MALRVKCLLVDDLEENLVALSALLAADDVEVLKAHSGAEALELLLVHDVALAFLDVQMPEMDGFELAELMRGAERTRDVPLIFVTAGEHDQHRVFKGYETGAVDFLYKPVDPCILRNKAGVFFQLYRQKQQLAQELQEKSDTLRFNEMFTAVLGHDLRNPLGAMMISAQLIQYRSDDDVVKETAGRILSSGRRMSNMIDDLLDLARARLAGGIPIKRGPMDLGLLVHRVVHEHKASFPEKRIEVVHEGDLGGVWDADRLAQIVSNLVGNALQYGKPGGGVSIHVDGHEPDHATLTVTNEGAIPEDVLPHIFDPFRRGQRQPGMKDGLGLGLYIVQQTVQSHEGTVDVDSRDDRTRFRVRLPRKAW
jgi:two-component system sensor histidine kinase/response regulator